MDLDQLKQRIKQIIFETTNIPPDEIGDHADFVADLGLDSLTLLEIGVNVDQEYDLDLPEDDMKRFINVQVSAELVRDYLSTQPS